MYDDFFNFLFFFLGLGFRVFLGLGGIRVFLSLRFLGFGGIRVFLSLRFLGFGVIRALRAFLFFRVWLQ